MTVLLLKIRLFLGSYAPLFLMLAIRFDDRNLWIGCAVLGLLAAGSMFLLLRAAHRIDPDPHKVATVANRGSEVAGYLATYLLPFVTVSEPSWRDLLAYAFFVGIVGIVYIQSEMFQINPLLYLLGLKVFAVTTEDGWSGFLITREELKVGSVVLASRLENTLALQGAKRQPSRTDGEQLAAQPGVDPDR